MSDEPTPREAAEAAWPEGAQWASPHLDLFKLRDNNPYTLADRQRAKVIEEQLAPGIKSYRLNDKDTELILLRRRVKALEDGLRVVAGRAWHEGWGAAQTPQLRAGVEDAVDRVLAWWEDQQ